MPLTAARKQELARMNLPSDAAMRDRIRVFVARSGMTFQEFGDAIGFSRVAVTHFLHGRYNDRAPLSDSTQNIRAKAKEYMDAHELAVEVEAAGPHYETKAFPEARRAALNALRRGTAYIIDGPPGTEKTESLRRIRREIREKKLGRCVYLYARVNHSPQSFLRDLCREAGIPDGGTIDQLIRKLRFFLASGRTLLMIDEGQHLDHATLEVLRQLLDLPPHFGVILAGSHDLTIRLSNWQMEQWRSRVRKTIQFNGPTLAECRTALRSVFGARLSDKACDVLIEPCWVESVRVELVKGKRVEKPFRYISIRDFSFAIERAQEAMHTPQQQEGAA